MYQTGDTIVAISTAPGMGAIGIVRLSGPEAIAWSARVGGVGMEGKSKRSFQRVLLRDPNRDETIDEGLLLWMPSPKSATGEDVAEIHAHGSQAVLRRLVELFVSLGARPAEPGEFTYRAFLNGKMDLTQAEAVQTLVASQGEQERKQSVLQLTGGMASHLEPVEESLKNLHLQVEVRIEFPEDGLAPIEKDSFLGQVRRCLVSLERLLDSYRSGRVLREGLSVALAGAPNVGKSSLLNALLGEPRAIVTHLPGTTRDLIEGHLILSGLRVRLFDTAGIRDTEEQVEAEGIRRAREAAREADLVFWVMDASRPEQGRGEALGYRDDPRVWLVHNKVDLAVPGTQVVFPGARTFHVSCLTGEGLDALRDGIESWAKGSVGDGGIILLQERHRREIQAAVDALHRLEDAVQEGQMLDLWAEDTREAILAIGRIRGRDLGREAFENIFSRFCIGK